MLIFTPTKNLPTLTWPPCMGAASQQQSIKQISATTRDLWAYSHSLYDQLQTDTHDQNMRITHWSPVPPLTALRRTVALNSSPMALSWLATLLISISCTASSLGALWCVETQDGCSFWGSRSGRGPCRLQASWCSSLSESAAGKIKYIQKIRY